MSLSSVQIKSESSTSYTRVIADKYGNYLATIPSYDNSASVVIASRDTANVGLIRVGKNGNEILAEGANQIFIENIPDLETENLFYIVISSGKKTSQYEFKIVKHSNNTSVETVIAERGTEDEYIAKDASCGGGSTVVPEEPDGSKEYPFEISTPAELQNMSKHPDKHYILMNDIDMSGSVWTPVGNTDTPFTGTLKGKGKTISNLTINASASNQAYGLFGVNKGTVENLKLDNVIITSADNTTQQSVGAVAGRNEEGALISQVAVSAGDIKSSNLAGGITGENRGIINNSYNKANITSAKYAAGIAALNYGTIENVYSIGSTKTTQSVNADNYVAAITVSNFGDSVIGNAYTIIPYQINVAKNSNLNVFNSSVVMPEKLQNQDTFNNWDFENIWTIYTGQYPTLKDQSADGDISDLNIPDGSPARPFQITTAIGFKSIGNDAESLSKHYVLMNNISMKDGSGKYIELDPIGSEETPFTGTLNGNGYTVSEVMISSEKTVDGENYSAIFAVNNGTVKNLVISPRSIEVSGNAAVIAGVNNGDISQVAVVSGRVSSTTD